MGGGASSLGLVPKPGLIVGVDPLRGMLESFRVSAGEAGVAVRAGRRLYVGPERDPEIERFLRDREPQEHRVAALWWRGSPDDRPPAG